MRFNIPIPTNRWRLTVFASMDRDLTGKGNVSDINMAG